MAVHTCRSPRSTADGLTGPAATLRIYPTVTSITSSTTRAIKGRAFTHHRQGDPARASTLGVAGMPVTLQRHVKGEKVWRTVSTAATTTNGTRAWAVKQSQLDVLPRRLQGRDDLARHDLGAKAVAVR